MTTTTMYDSVTPSNIPANAQMVAAYVDGDFANVAAMQARFPTIPILTIAVSSADQADALDVENGDASVASIDGWLADHALKGIVVKLPMIYMSLDTAKASFPTSHPNGCYLWTAHYTYIEHICGPACGLPYNADATQWTDNPPNNPYDTSAVQDDILVPRPPQDQTGTVHSVTTGQSASVSTTDGGQIWLYRGSTPGPRKYQSGTVTSDTTHETAIVVTDDGGLHWYYAGQ